MKKYIYGLQIAALVVLMGIGSYDVRAQEPASEVEVTEAEAIIDLSDFTDDEIIALLKQLQNEIVSRGIEKTAELKEGYYVVGQDIPVGKYTVTKVESAIDEEAEVFIYDNMTDKNELVEWELETSEDVCSVSLVEGNIFFVRGQVTLAVSPGVTFE